MISYGKADDQLMITPAPETCELIDYTTVHYCKALDQYNMTYLPNARGHTSQFEAFSELATFGNAILSNCSGAILDFLCSYYVPLCFDNGQVVQLLPCSNLCEEVYNGCNDDLMNNGGLVTSWPEHLNCSLFPSYGSQVSCFGPSDPSQLVIPSLIPGLNAPAPTSTTTSVVTPQNSTTIDDPSSLTSVVVSTPLETTTVTYTATSSTATVAPTTTPDLTRPDSGCSLKYSFITALVSVVLGTLMMQYLR